MEGITATQTPSEDVRELWNLNPPDSEMRRFLVDYIAIRCREEPEGNETVMDARRLDPKV